MQRTERTHKLFSFFNMPSNVIKVLFHVFYKTPTKTEYKEYIVYYLHF